MNKSKRDVLFFVLLMLLGISMPLPAAIFITPTQNVGLLTNALLGSEPTGIDHDSINMSYSGHSCTDCGFSSTFESMPATSTGTFSNDNVYGMGSGLIMSTGGVSESVVDAGYPPYGPTGDGHPATPQQNELLKPITGANDHNDVTQLTINFDMLQDFDRVVFNVIFASDEGGNIYPDGFGLYINGTNIAHVFDQPVFAEHPSMKTTIGTRYESALGGGAGSLESIHLFSTTVNPTNNEAIIILGDAVDGEVQSAVFISVSPVPIPPSILLFLCSISVLGLLRLKKEFSIFRILNVTNRCILHKTA